MTARAEALRPQQAPLSGSRAPGWWGMLCLIATEGTLFSILLFSYYYLRWQSPRWPPDGVDLPKFTYIIPATILLLGSSLPVMFAEWSIRRGRQAGLRFGYLLGWLMAAAFMALELWEWHELPYGPKTNAYASLFFTITGLHLIHLGIAMLLSAYVQVRAWLGHFDAGHTLAVENVSLYWHFVDVVWIAIFCTLYLSPFIT